MAVLLGFRCRGSCRSANTRAHIITTLLKCNFKWGYVQSMDTSRWMLFIKKSLLNCRGTDQTKAMQNNSISLESLEWVTSSIHMIYTGGRRLERKFSSLRRKEWERRCCNLDWVDSCWDISDSPRCCLQLVSSLERKWKWKENEYIKMGIASATYNSQFSCSVVRTTEIIDELSSSSFKTVSTSWKQRHVQPWGLPILMAG